MCPGIVQVFAAVLRNAVVLGKRKSLYVQSGSNRAQHLCQCLILVFFKNINLKEKIQISAFIYSSWVLSVD